MITKEREDLIKNIPFNELFDLLFHKSQEGDYQSIEVIYRNNKLEEFSIVF